MAMKVNKTAFLGRETRAESANIVPAPCTALLEAIWFKKEVLAILTRRCAFYI
jgi:hypothetical protein